MAYNNNLLKNEFISENQLIFNTMSRFLQALIVFKYKGNGKAHALQIFRIPLEERNDFKLWLEKHNTEFLQLLQTSGFISLGTKGKLTKIEKAYKKDKPGSKIGWLTVPMKSNSIILWKGIHRVQNGKGKKDKDSFRSVMYMNLLRSPCIEHLPKSWETEDKTWMQNGKSFNHAIEIAYQNYYAKKNLNYGWNKTTISDKYEHMFAGSPNLKPAKMNLTLQELDDMGYVMFENVLDSKMADKLHYKIVDIIRTVLFKIERQGMNEDVRKTALQLSNDEFTKQINEPKFKKARYFKRNTTNMYCGFDIPDAKMKNLQGVQGYTLKSQMIDIQSHPLFAKVLIQLHPLLEDKLGYPVYFGKERCSLRSFGAANLDSHIDEPVF